MVADGDVSCGAGFVGNVVLLLVGLDGGAGGADAVAAVAIAGGSAFFGAASIR